MRAIGPVSFRPVAGKAGVVDHGDSPATRHVQLDAVRALAVLGVVLWHSVDQAEARWAQFGAEGVRLFFVISGFLITGILVDARRSSERAGVGRGPVLRAFYARRCLRIFPIYYLTLAVAAIIGVHEVRDTIVWNAAYLANWRIAFDGHWGVATHTWSLAVEEQFYLFWPLIVLFAPRRWLLWIASCMVLIGPTTRIVLTLATDMWSEGITILTPSTFDGLGAGATLALLWRSRAQVDRIVDRVGVLAVVIFVADRALAESFGASAELRAATSLWWPLAFAWCVHRAARGVGGPVGRVLRWRPLLFVGTISYGVYLFHLFVLPAIAILERRTSISVPTPGRPGAALFVFIATISIAAASVSWSLFERPINNLKVRFPYLARATTDPSPRPHAGPVAGLGGAQLTADVSCVIATQPAAVVDNAGMGGSPTT